MTDKVEKDSQLKESFLNKDFGVSQEDLMALFEAENLYQPEDHSANNPNLSGSLSLLREHQFALAQKLLSDPQNGIEGSPDDIQRRVEAFGSNAKQSPGSQGFCSIVCDLLFYESTTILLVLVAILSIVFGILEHGWEDGYQEGVGLVIAVIIIVIALARNVNTEAQLSGEMNQSFLKVTRAGAEQSVVSDDLVVGDIIHLSVGQDVPADCLVIQAEDAFVNEAQLTGEPDSFQKQPASEANIHEHPDPFIRKGSKLEGGSITALVLAVGEATQMGEACSPMSPAQAYTPLYKVLEDTMELMTMIAGRVACLIFLIICVSGLIRALIGDQTSFDGDFFLNIGHGMLFSVLIYIVIVPTSLPLFVILWLQRVVQDLYCHNTLVRSLRAPETLNYVTDIMTEKTGTLTQNKFAVHACYLEKITYHEMGDLPRIKDMKSGPLISSAIIHSSSAQIDSFINPYDGTPQTLVQGNITERGLFEFLRDQQVNYEQTVRERDQSGSTLTLPFDSRRKRMTTVYKHGDGYRLYMKAASEMGLMFCTRIIGQGGQIEQLSDENKQCIVKDVIEQFGHQQALRTLLVAYKDLSSDEFESLKAASNDFTTPDGIEAVEKDMIMVGIFGLRDTLRRGIKETVQQYQEMGITVRMVTGDNLVTAKIIALDAGIIKKEDLESDEVCTEGPEFVAKIGASMVQQNYGGAQTQPKGLIEKMDQMRVVADKLRVMARSTPDQKYHLVDGLSKLGRTVAVTASGTNDLPAVVRADISFAMGIQGTDTCNQACSISILDDNFSTIFAAAYKCRSGYDNLRMFAQYSFTVTSVLISIALLGAVLFDDLPFSLTQLLWVKLISDKLAVIALSQENVQPGSMSRPPEKKNVQLVTAPMMRNIFGQSIFQTVVLVILYLYGGDFFGVDFEMEDPCYPTAEDVADNPGRGWVVEQPTGKVMMFTIIFQVFVFMQIFNLFNARKTGEREFNVVAGLLGNCRFFTILIGITIVQMLLVSYCDRYFGTVTLSRGQNGWCILIASSVLVWGAILKLVPSRLFASCTSKEEEHRAEDDLGGDASIDFGRDFQRARD